MAFYLSNFMKYTKQQLLNISNNQENLEKEIKITYGKILFLMEKENILPDVEILIDIDSSYVGPFLFSFYHLSDEQINRIKARSSNSHNNHAFKAAKINNALFSNVEKIEKIKITDLKVDKVSPNLAAKMILEDKSFLLTSEQDLNFLNNTLKNISEEDIKKREHKEFLLDFTANCIKQSYENNTVFYPTDEFNKINTLVKSYIFLTSDEQKNIERSYCIQYVDNSFFKENAIIDWAEKNSHFNNIPVQEINKVNLNSTIVKNAFKKVFNKAKKEGFNKYDYQFFRELVTVPNLMYFKVEENIINYWGDEITRDIFENNIPELWNIADFNNPQIQKEINNHILDSNNLLNFEADFVYKDKNINMVFTDNKLSELVHSINWSAIYNIYPAVKNKKEINKIALIYMKAINYALDKNISLFPKNEDMKNYIPIGSLMSCVLRNDLFPEFTQDSLNDFFNELAKNEKLFTYDRAFDLFSKNSNKPFFEKGKYKHLEAFIEKVFIENPTPDKYLIICNDLTLSTSSVKIKMLSKLNPYDVEILKDLTNETIQSVLLVKGDDSAPRGNASNCSYMNPNFFKKENGISMFHFFSNGEHKSFVKHLLESDEMLLSGNDFLEISNKAGYQSFLKDWKDFIVQYQAKFPGFITLNQRNRKIIAREDYLSELFKFDDIKDDIYSYVLDLNDRFTKCVNSKEYEALKDIENSWKEIPFVARQEFFNKFIDSGDWKNVSLLMFNELGNMMDTSKEIAKQIFYKCPHDFMESDFFKNEDSHLLKLNELISNLDKVLYSKEQLTYIIEKTIHHKGLSHLWLNLGNSLSQEYLSNMKILKDIVLSDKPYCILIEGISERVDLDRNETYSCYLNTAKKMDKNLFDALYKNKLTHSKGFENPDDWKDLFNEISNLPEDKQLIFCALFSVKFNLMEIDQKDKVEMIFKNLLPEFNRVGDDFNLHTNETPLLLAYMPKLLNQNELAKNNKFWETYNFLRSEERKWFTKNAFNGSLIIEYPDNTKNVYISISPFNKIIDFRYQYVTAPLIENNDFFEAFVFAKEYDLVDAFAKSIKVNDKSFEKTLELIKEIDAHYNLKSFKYLNKHKELLDSLAEKLNDAILNGSLSDDNIKTLIFASNGAILNAKVGKESDMTTSEYVVFLNGNLRQTLEAISLKNDINDVFRSFIDTKEEEQPDEDWGVKI